MGFAHLYSRMFFAAFILVLIFLSGCVKVETYEQFYPNGRSRVVSQIYMKNLINTMNVSGISPPQEGTWKNYFEQECLRLQQYSQGSICHVTGDWLIFDEGRISGKDFILTAYEAFPYTMYELTILAPPIPPLGEFREVGEFEIPDELEFSKFNETTYAQLTSSGMSYNYMISLPGEVLETTHGRAEYNVVSFNVLEVVRSKTPIRIKARALNFWQLFTLIAGVILLFLILDFSIIWFLREWSKRKEVSDEIRRKKDLEDARRRVFRKDSRLQGNEVYMAPGGKISTNKNVSGDKKFSWHPKTK